MNASDLIIDSALRGGLLGAGAWIGYRMFRSRSSAALRHRILAAALAALALMPVLIGFCGGWKILPPIKATSAQSRSVPQTESPARISHRPVSVSTVKGPIEETAQRTSPPQGSLPPLVAHQETSHASPFLPWREFLVPTWLFVALVLGAFAGLEMIRLLRVTRNSMACDAPELNSLAAACARRIGLAHSPRIRLTSNKAGPLVSGLIRSTILLPSSAVRWPTERCRAVLLHEMAHVRRRDALVQVIGALVAILHWFNPFGWMLLRALRHEAECACDDVVLGADMGATHYAEHLLAIASEGRCASALAPSMARSTGLRERVQSVLNQTMRRGGVGRMAGLAVAIVVTMMSLPLILAQTAVPKPPADKPTNTKPDLQASISVSTVNEAGAPLGTVHLRIFDMGARGPLDPWKPDFDLTTDDQGHWAGSLPFGEFMVFASKDQWVAYYNNSQTWWYLRKTNPKSEHKLVLAKGDELHVTVLDNASHKPVPHAKVIIDHGNTGLTDEHGQALLDAVPMGEGVMLVASPPYADLRIHFNSNGQAEMHLEALLSPGFEVRGRVTNTRGEPIAAAVVNAEYSGKRFQVDMQRCITDANGEYHLGWYSKAKPLGTLEANHPEYARNTKHGISPPAEGAIAHWDFVMNEGYGIDGAVKDESGQPIKGATISYGSLTAKSDEEGKYRLARIGSQWARVVVAEAPGYAPGLLEPSAGRDGTGLHLDFQLNKGLTVKGQVVDRSGKPLGGMMISPMILLDHNFQYVGGRYGVNAKGEFEIPNLPSSKVALDVYGTGISAIRRLEFDPTKPLHITVDKPGVISGKVVDADTREPIKKFNVRLDMPPKSSVASGEPVPSYDVHLSSPGQLTETEDGHFLIDDLVARAGHVVAISSEGYVEKILPKVLAQSANDPGWPLIIPLDRGLEISGRLVDAVTGKPVGGAKVYYVGKDRWWSGSIRASDMTYLRDSPVYNDVSQRQSDVSGQVSLRLPVGTSIYTVAILANGYAPQLLENQPISQIVLQAGPMLREAKLRGTFAGLRGLRPDTDNVYVVTATYNANQISLHPDGTFETAGLPPGPAGVSVHGGANEIRGSALVNLTAGETTTVNVLASSKCVLKVIATQNGHPVADADVYVQLKDQKKYGASLIGSGITEADGSIVIQHLPAEEAFVTLTNEQRKIAVRKEVTLAPGETPVVKFE